MMTGADEQLADGTCRGTAVGGERWWVRRPGQGLQQAAERQRRGSGRDGRQVHGVRTR